MLLLSICIIIDCRHKCDGRSGCPWSCRVMVKNLPWSFFFIKYGLIVIQ